MIIGKADIRETDKVVFLHIPKTAGSSTRIAMQEAYGDRFFNLTPFDNPSAGEDPEKTKDFQAFSGHIFINHPIFDNFDRIVSITTLRDPVDMVLSQYGFLMASTIHPLHDLALKTPLDEILTNGNPAGAWGMSNLMVKFLTGMDEGDERLDIAKENLKSRFTFFGYVESYGSFVRACNEYIPAWNVEEKQENIIEVPFEHSDHTVELIRDLNRLDIELYEYAKELPNAIL